MLNNKRYTVKDLKNDFNFVLNYYEVDKEEGLNELRKLKSDMKGVGPSYKKMAEDIRESLGIAESSKHMYK